MKRDSLSISAEDIATIKSSWTTLGALRELLDIACSEPFDLHRAHELVSTDTDLCHSPSDAYAYISDSLHRIANNISDLGDRVPLHRHVLDPFFTRLPDQLDELYAQTQSSYVDWESKQERKRAIGRLFALRPARPWTRADANAEAESDGGETRSGNSSPDLDNRLAEDTRRQLEDDRQAAWDAVQGSLQSLVLLTGELERRFPDGPPQDNDHPGAPTGFAKEKVSYYGDSPFQEQSFQEFAGSIRAESQALSRAAVLAVRSGVWLPLDTYSDQGQATTSLSCLDNKADVVSLLEHDGPLPTTEQEYRDILADRGIDQALKDGQFQPDDGCTVSRRVDADSHQNQSESTKDGDNCSSSLFTAGSPDLSVSVETSVYEEDEDIVMLSPDVGVI